MASRLQKIPSGNESRGEGENDEMGIPNYCERSRLNYIEHYFILASPITGCISISAFPSLLGISLGVKSFAIGLKICTIAVGIEKCKSIIKRKKTKHDKIVFLPKPK